jgi:hypothetical protein
MSIFSSKLLLNAPTFIASLAAIAAVLEFNAWQTPHPLVEVDDRDSVLKSNSPLDIITLRNEGNSTLVLESIEMCTDDSFQDCEELNLDKYFEKKNVKVFPQDCGVGNLKVT